MNEFTLTQLKIIVERAVRPVQASSERKQKMREELLAHVSAVFEEEAQRGDESATLERVAARFGKPAELTRQLQDAVPLGDRIPWFVEKLIGFPARESTLRRAARHAFLVGGFCTVFLVITILARSDRSEWLTTTRVPALFAVVNMTFLTFCGTLAAGALRRALFGPRTRSWVVAGLVVAATWLLIPATTFVFCLAFSRNIGVTFSEVWPTVPLGVLAPVALLLFVCWSDAEIRCHEEWANLEIGDRKEVPS